MAAANNMRVKVLRKKMEDLQKRRALVFGKPDSDIQKVDCQDTDAKDKTRRKKFMLDALSDIGSKSKQERDAEVCSFSSPPSVKNVLLSPT